MFNNPFSSETTKNLKALDKQFLALNEKYKKAELREQEIRNELEAIASFKANPFKELSEAQNTLISENLVLIPDLRVNAKLDDSSLFSIAYNDLLSALDCAVGEMSAVGWVRLYKKVVKNSNDVLMFKAFYRMLSANVRDSELQKLEPLNVPLYADYAMLTGDTANVDKIKVNLAAIEHINAIIKKHFDDIKSAQKSIDKHNMGMRFSAAGT